MVAYIVRVRPRTGDTTPLPKAPRHALPDLPSGPIRTGDHRIPLLGLLLDYGGAGLALLAVVVLALAVLVPLTVYALVGLVT